MMPMWAYKLNWREIGDAAAKHGLSPLLVGSVVMTESGGKTNATRYEPAFKWVTEDYATIARNLGITPETEKMQQMTSWGLLQIMGSTARGQGFSGSLIELTKPELGLEYGCRYLKSKLKNGASVEAALSAYNSGTARKTIDGRYENQTYVDKVVKYLKELEGSA